MWMGLVLAALAQDAPPPPAVAVVVANEPSVDTVSTRLSLLPGVGWNAAPGDRVEGVSVGAISHAVSLEGVDLELGMSWVDQEVEGVQASVGINVAGDVDGVQLTSGVNWARGDVSMAQLSAGANVARGDVKGLQGASGLNVAGGSVQGLQASGGLNVALGEASKGLQAAGGANIANTWDGLQAAPLNVARDVRGVQLGVVNVADSSGGLQLGVVNIAKTSNVSIAPINLIADGLHRVDIWASESAFANAGVKFGSKHVYTLLGVGWVNPDQPWWTFGGGLGVHLAHQRMWFEADASTWGIAAGHVLAPGVHNQLRAQVGLDLVRDHVAPFVGLSMNTWVGTGAVWPRAVDLPSRVSGNNRVVSWPGIHAGVSF